MKVKLLVALVALMALAVSASAQQDPLDKDEADSLILAWAHTPDVAGGDSLVAWEAYALNDYVLGSLSPGFKWSFDGLELDSAVLSAEALDAFDMMRIIYYKNDVDSSNYYDRFQLVLGMMFSSGLGPGRTRLATYYGHVTSFTATDSIVVDSSGFNAFLFVEGTAPEFAPRFGGPITFKEPAGVSINGLGSLPTTFDLDQNYPNPFNPTTIIAFDIPERTHASLTVFNVLGQRVATLVDEELSPNRYQVVWDGTADGGHRVASGIYFYRLTAQNTVMTKKMMLLK